MLIGIQLMSEFNSNLQSHQSTSQFSVKNMNRLEVSSILLLITVIIRGSFGARGRSRSAEDFIHRPNVDGVEYFRCVQNGTIAITFDDGPRVGRTEQVVAALQTLDVPATFFVVGNNYGTIYDSANQALVHEVVANGNSIASHTWSHARLTTIFEAGITQEMNRLANALTLILGKAPTIMRPPYGARDEEVIRIVNGVLGYKLILWSIDTHDWEHPGDTAAGLAEYQAAIDGTNPSETPGFIVLHHDPQEGGAELATAAINYSRGQGYRFVSLQECLGFDF